MYKYETHFHTQEVSPCGKVPAQEGVRMYAEAGYQGLVVTDHFYRGQRDLYTRWEEYVDHFLHGYQQAYEFGKKIGFTVLLGMEIRFDDDPNDYLVYGFDESFLYDEPCLLTMGLQSFHRSYGDLPWIIAQAHPYRKHCTVADAEHMNGLEVFNGNPRHDSQNDVAHAYANKHELFQISGSDFHQIPDLARGGVILSKKCERIDCMVREIKEGNYELIQV